MRSLMLTGLAATFLITLSGCVTPVIPLPPPDVNLVSLTGIDTTNKVVTIVGADGTTSGGAYIFILNITTAEGRIGQADENGGFSIEDFPAADGDSVDFWVKRTPYDKGGDVLNLYVDYQNRRLAYREP